MNKTLFIVSGGIEAVDAAKRAKEMGLYVVVSDRDPEAPDSLTQTPASSQMSMAPLKRLRRRNGLVARFARLTASSAWQPMRPSR